MKIKFSIQSPAVKTTVIMVKTTAQPSNLSSKKASVFSNVAGFRRHSHIMMIFQPSFLSDLAVLSSLALLVVILFSRQLVLVFGNYIIFTAGMTMSETTMY